MSETVDPKKIRIEDIFRAKQERRRRLAKLPFKEKIEIVNKLKKVPLAAMPSERLIFEAFLKADPQFGSNIQEWGVVDEWYRNHHAPAPSPPFDKRPDVIATTRSGKKIGIELKRWVNKEQIAEAKKQERINENIVGALGILPSNPTHNIGYLTLYPKEVVFNPKEASDFREQLFKWIKEVDSSWSPERFSERSSKNISQFGGFPLLERYLNRIKIKPAIVTHHRHHWIRGAYPQASHYSPDTTVEVLIKALLKYRDDDKYKDLKDRLALDEVYLLVHYDFKAFAYNTPFRAPGIDLKEVAQLASKKLNGNAGYFNGIFLFHFWWGKEEVYRIL